MVKRRKPEEVTTVGDYIEIGGGVFRVHKLTGKDITLRSVPVPDEMQKVIDERNSQPDATYTPEPQQLATDGE